MTGASSVVRPEGFELSPEPRNHCTVDLFFNEHEADKCSLVTSGPQRSWTFVGFL